MTKTEKIESLTKELDTVKRHLKHTKRKLIGCRRMARERQTAVTILRRVAKTYYGDKVYGIDTLTTKDSVLQFLNSIEKRNEK